MSQRTSPSVEGHEARVQSWAPTITSPDSIADRHEFLERWCGEKEGTPIFVSDSVACNDQESSRLFRCMPFQSVLADSAKLAVPRDLEGELDPSHASVLEDDLPHNTDLPLNPQNGPLIALQGHPDSSSSSPSDICSALERLTIDEGLEAAHDADGITYFEDMRLVGHNRECINTSPALDQNPRVASGSSADDDKSTFSELDLPAPDMPALLANDSPNASKLYKLGTAPSKPRKGTKPHRRASSSGGIEVKHISIDSDAWKTGALVGQGTYGRVYRVSNRITGSHLAMKVIDIDQPVDRIICDGMVNELLVLDTLAHYRGPLPYLLCPTTKRTWSWRTSDNYLCMLTDYCPGGQLSEHIGRLPDRPRLRRILAELVVGISDLHLLGIVHHDLKPENILIDADGHCVIVDYGGAKFMNDENLVSLNIEDDVMCTLNYTAPELLSNDCDNNGNKWYDCSVDWWALGAVIMSLTTGKEYFAGESMMDLLTMMPYYVECIRDTLQELGYSDTLIDLVEGLLTVDPNRRLGIDAIREHPYFDDVDWALVETRDDDSPFYAGSTSEGPIRPVDTHDIFFPQPDKGDHLFIDVLHEGGLDLDIDDSIIIPV